MKDDWLNNQDLNAHALEPVNSLLEGLDMKDDYEDIKDKAEDNHHESNVHFKSKTEINREEYDIFRKREKRATSSNGSYVNVDDLLAEKSSLDLIPEWDGYYIGDVWSAQRNKNLQRLKSRQRDHVNSYAQRPFYQNVDNHG